MATSSVGRGGLFCGFALAGLVGCGVLWGQGSTGSVAGRVVDPDGRAVVGATVVVRNTDLGSARTVTTDAGGAFRVTGLVPGAVTVEGKAKGLVLRRPVRVTLGLGSTVEVRLALSLETVKQRSTVTARGATSEGNTVAPPVNRDEAAVSSFFAGTVVTYLPLRDREYTQLAELGAGTTEDVSGSGVIVAGQRSSSTLTEVDGVGFNDALEGGRRGAADGTFFLPQTVVREFQIVRSGVSAEVGGTGAGLVNAATKEGSNKLHGEAFYTVRPAWASSADAFGHSLENRQNTFGLSFGGPVTKDRVFYYVGVEQDFLHAPYFTQFAPQFASQAVPAGLAGLQGEAVQGSSPTAFFVRGDGVLNRANTLNVEVSENRVRANDAGAGSSRSLATADHQDGLSGQSVWSKVSLATVVTERSVNQATVSWSEDHRDFTPHSFAAERTINGFGTLGGDSLGMHLFTSEQVQVADGMTWSWGRRLLSVGGAFAGSAAYEDRVVNQNGRFDYDSLGDYLANAPRRFQQTFVTGDTRYSGTVRQGGLFANLKAAAGRSLTVTAGMRWDGQWNPQPGHPNAAIVQTTRVPDDVTQWQPRVGMAWAPGTKTVVRVSSGIYTAATPATYFQPMAAENGLQTVVADSYFDPQVLGTALAAGGALGSAPVGLRVPHAVVDGIDGGFRNPRSLQAAGTVERSLTGQITASAGYLHESTWRVERRVDRNLNPPVNGVFGARPNAAIGRLLVEESGAHSDYNGLLVSAVDQISRRSSVTVNYTLSDTHDDATTTGGAFSGGTYSLETAVNPFDLRAERAFSSLDVRHVLNVNAIFNLPLGLKCNPVFVARSGRPYTPIIGFDVQGDANDFNDRVAARNSARQPALTDVDLRLVKDFTLKGVGHHLDLFLDVFNLGGASNRNFGMDGVSFYGTAARPVASAGEALFAPDATRIGGPRTIQFTARLVAF